ncbi:hypothetical protein WAI453_000656 [Rhynchosporium graminicola]|uniref:Peptidase S1 domain-containing protein n=1 Tax=Rhynchosporium graminicola TaxID=2792576 RepID=A0A1E1JR43_9HELO|nr:uncharacterized protein RCO7_01192 [Rhynchosporium commune]
MAKGSRRQYQSNDSEPGQQSGFVTIEHYMAGKDPYRVAPADEMPVPWPFVTHPKGEELGNIENSIRGECMNICQQHSITVRSVKVEVLSRKDYPSLPVPIPYLIIYTLDTNRTRWQAAANDLRNLVAKDRFRSSNGNFIKVEVRNPARMYADFTTCLPVDQELQRYLDEVEPRIYALVLETLPSSWTMVCSHMRGPRSTQSLTPPRPTILVYVKPETVHSFDSTEEKYREALTYQNFPNIVMNIEILAGFVTKTPCRMPYEAKHLFGLNTTRPYNGVSISAANLDDESGTLGGWIRLTSNANPNQVTDYMLTCYHVVAAADPENEDDNNERGIGFFGSQHLPHIDVVWPSVQDEVFTRSEANRKIREGSADANIRQSLALLNQINGAGRIVGKVRYASGFAKRSPTNGYLDWALIPSPGTSQPNRPPQEIYDRQNLAFGSIYRPTANDYIRRIAPEPQVNDWVVRSGRTSANHGIVEQRYSYIVWEDDETRKPSYEMEIVSHHGDPDFCHAGDSGSWVVNHKYELVGMLIGQTGMNSGNNGIVTPVRDLFADIEARTNCTVSLPLP